MKAFVYAGGTVFAEGVDGSPDPADLTVAADAGWNNAQMLGVTPRLLVGDFDSLGEPCVPAGTEIIRVPAEKDDTDTQLAVRVALERGATDITLIAGLSGRVDHTLSTLAILEELERAGRGRLRAILTDGRNRVRFLRAGSALIPRDGRFRYLSLIAATERVRGVTVEGCKYPLHNATLWRRNQYAVSNEIVGNAALIAVRRGAVYVIESGDG